MSLESDFNDFKDEVLKYAREKSEEIINNVLKEREERLKIEEKKAEEIYKKRLKDLKLTIMREKNESINNLEYEYRNRRLELIEKKREEVVLHTREYIKSRFKELASCFLTSLSKEFKDGDVFVPEELLFLKDIHQNFNFHTHRKGAILFSKDNVLIRFSENTVLEEYRDIIDTEVLNAIGI